MPTTLYQKSIGKRPGQSLVATSATGHTSSRLFYICDRTSKLNFLIDTGAEVSLIPITRYHKHLTSQDGFTLQAANGSIIKTYGRQSLTLNLGQRHSYQWIFIVADVKRPILGADFINHFNLHETVWNICDGNTPYHAILKEFPILTSY